MWDFGLRIADCGFDKAWSIGHGEIQLAASNWQQAATFYF
jgi:hypothetical protein